MAFDKDKTYWNNNGRYTSEYNSLSGDLVPASGPADTKSGELLRAIGNRYYDLLNNGDCQNDIGLGTIEERADEIIALEPDAKPRELVKALRRKLARNEGDDEEPLWDDFDDVHFDTLWEMFDRVIDGAVRLVWKIERGEDPKAVAVANATSRCSGAVGKNAIVPRYVSEHVSKGKRILDFGAGSKAIHVEALRRDGFKDVTGWECGKNFDEGVHDRDALMRQYEVVYASNVLNVQSSWADVIGVVSMVHGLLEQGGGSAFVCNLPLSPRKGAWALDRDDRGEEAVRFKRRDLNALHRLLAAFFMEVEIVGGAKWAPIFKASNPKRFPTEVSEGPDRDD